ncbi:MAG: integration host factor subunit alpha [bacterium]
MIKADLAQVVHETHGGISYEESAQIVDTIIDCIKTRLVNLENVKLTGFGTFNVIHREGRRGRNPQTGERMQLAPSRYVTFRCSKLIDL